jgi:Ca-activated chloride channel homolog
MQADFILDFDQLTLERAQTLHLLARFVSGPAPEDESRRALNLSLVIDRSGSMAGDKLDYTRQAAQFLVQNLGVRDTISIVLYNDAVETLLMPEKVQRKDIISQRIAGIKASGTTNLSSGWLEGCNLVSQNHDDHALNRVILMSDGLANRGVTDTEQLVRLARQKLDAKISTTTMGLGNDFNEDLLMAMASAGGGAFYFIESPEVAPLIFKEELQGLLSVVGQNLTITIVPSSPQTGIRQLNAYPQETSGQGVSYRIGDVFGDEVKALMLELAIPAQKQSGQQQIATLRFEYDELTNDTSEHKVIELPVMVNVQAQIDEPLLPNPEVSQPVLLLQAAQARREAIKAADNGEFNTASQVLRTVADAIEKSGGNDPRLIEEQKALLRQAADLERGSEQYGVYKRKTMSTQALYSMTSRHDHTVMLRSREEKRESGAAPESSDADWSVEIERREGIVPTHVSWKEHTFALEGDLIRVGRSSHNEIVINAVGVSRFHCHLKRDGERLLLEDLGSTNGTTVGGKAIKESHTLSVGDVAYLCDEKLIFHDGNSLKSD